MLYLCVFTILAVCHCLPPRQRMQPEPESKPKDEPSISLEGFGIEYTRYLQEVVEALEKDEHFKRKLEQAQPDEIQSAKIAEELEFVNHKVRSKLDELKRHELQRLRSLARKMNTNEYDYHHSTAGHVDHGNPNTFEVRDLQKLIRKAVADLEEADKKRKEEFKKYELEKHFEREQKLKNMTEEDRIQFLQHEEEIKKQEHEAQKKVHHPGSKQQLEEVWEEQDHMSKSDFDPRTFFAMHDVDGNGFLDEEEIKTLFVKESDKLYAAGTLQGDAVERAEEMDRMREHVFSEIDKNRDRLISWEEFHSMSLRNDFTEDPGWQPIHDQQIYSPDEWQAYQKQRLAESEGFYQHPPQIPVQINETHYQYAAYPNQNVHHGAGEGGYYHPAGAVPPQAPYPQHGDPRAYVPQKPVMYENAPGSNLHPPVQQPSEGQQAQVPVHQPIPPAHQQASVQPQARNYQQSGIYQQQAQHQAQPGSFQQVPPQQAQKQQPQVQYAAPSEAPAQQRHSAQYNSNNQQRHNSY